MSRLELCLIGLLRRHNSFSGNLALPGEDDLRSFEDVREACLCQIQDPACAAELRFPSLPGQAADPWLHEPETACRSLLRTLGFLFALLVLVRC
jgi:hypothetical protein